MMSMEPFSTMSTNKQQAFTTTHSFEEMLMPVSNGVEPIHTWLAEQTRTTTKEMRSGESNGCGNGANIKVDFVALLTCNETAHMLLAREEKGWTLLMAASAAMTCIICS
jgi:hypothetical protein